MGNWVLEMQDDAYDMTLAEFIKNMAKAKHQFGTKHKKKVKGF